MAHHRTGPLIDKVAKLDRPPWISQRGGIVVTDQTGDNVIHEKAQYFGGGAHTEPSLLTTGLLAGLGQGIGKVTLYTYFAPCPSCAKYLANFPATYETVKFMLAFWDHLPVSASYTRKDVEIGLQSLHVNGWKIRHWTPGTYRPAQKLGGYNGGGMPRIKGAYSDQQEIQNYFQEF